MTVNELIGKFNELQLRGDEEVRIYAFGGMRSGKSIKDVSVGFDWDNGAVILHPTNPLQLFPVKQAKG